MNYVYSIDKNVLGGEPVFINTRVPIRAFFDCIESGDSINDFLKNYPSVKIEQVKVLLESAYEKLFDINSLNVADK